MNQEIPTTAKNRPLFIIAIVTALLIAGAVLSFYSINANQQSKTTKPAVKPSTQSQTTTEVVKGQVLNFANKTLTIKNESGQQIQVKMASQAAIIKQKWFDQNSMGTIPAEVKAGDQVSVQTLKNSQGETEAISVVILTDKPETIETASPNGKNK